MHMQKNNAYTPQPLESAVRAQAVCQVGQCYVGYLCIIQTKTKRI